MDKKIPSSTPNIPTRQRRSVGRVDYSALLRYQRPPLTMPKPKKIRRRTTVRSNVLAKGHRVFTPFAYWPDKQPPELTGQLQNAIVLTNVIVRDTLGHCAKLTVVADNTSDVSLISRTTVDKFNLCPNVRCSMDPSERIIATYNSIDLKIFFNYTVMDFHAEITSEMQNDILIIGTKHLSMNDEYQELMLDYMH